MSLIVDVLKKAQKDVAARKPLPPFIKCSYEKDSGLRAFISRHAWLFSGALGFGIVTLFIIFMITRQGVKPISKASVSIPVTHSQKISTVLPKADNSQKISTVLPKADNSQKISTVLPKADNSQNSPVMDSQKISAVLPEARNFQEQSVIHSEKSVPEQKEKIRTIELEKIIVAPSPKDEMVELENSGGKVLLKKPSPKVKDQFYVALSHQKRGENEKAIEGYTKVIEMDPMNVEARTNLGVIYKNMGKPLQAVKEFQTVLSMNPKHENAHNNLGVIFYLQGNLKSAIQEFREVLDINPRNKEAYINLGVIYKKRNLIPKAKRMFENALSIDLHSPEANYNLGLICEESGDIKQAISNYQKFIDLSDSTYPELAAKVESRLKMLSQSQK